MKQQLRQPWYVQVPEQIRGYLFHNLALKGLAVLIVTAIWLSVTGQIRPRADIVLQDINIELLNIPPHLTVTSTDPQQVHARVSGSEDAIRELRLASALGSSELVAVADLSNTDQGVYIKQLRLQGLPERVQLQKISNPVVRVTLEPIQEREVSIEPRFIGELPPGYRRAGVQLMPATVTVRGAESRISQIDKLQTTTVSLSGRTGTFTEAVEVDIHEPDDISVVGPSQVALRVEIEEEVSEKVIENVPVTVPAQPAASVLPPTVTVKLRGPVSVLRALSAANLSATVPGDDPGARAAPQVMLRDADDARIEVVSVTPETVRLRK